MIWLIELQDRHLWLALHPDGTISAHPSLQHARGALRHAKAAWREVEAAQSGQGEWKVGIDDGDLLIRESEGRFVIEEAPANTAVP